MDNPKKGETMTTAQAVAALERIIVAAGQSDFSRETIVNARAGLDALLSELQTIVKERDELQKLLTWDKRGDVAEMTAQKRAELVVSWIKKQEQENFYLGTLTMNLVAEFEASERAARNAAIVEAQTWLRDQIKRAEQAERERDAANKKLEAFAHDVMCELHVHEANRLVDRAVCPLCERDAATQRAEKAERERDEFQDRLTSEWAVAIERDFERQQVLDVSATAEYYRALVQDARDERDAAITECIKRTGIEQDVQHYKERAEQAEAFMRRLSAVAADSIEEQHERIEELESERDAAIADALRLAHIAKHVRIVSESENNLIEKYAR